jgi:hypothetical protein
MGYGGLTRVGARAGEEQKASDSGDWVTDMMPRVSDGSEGQGWSASCGLGLDVRISNPDTPPAQ